MPEAETTGRRNARRKIVYMPLDELVAADRNPKAHDEPLIEGAISRFGFIEPIVLDERTGKLVAGHGRLDDLRRREAAGLETAAGRIPEGIVVGRDGRWQAPVVRGWESVDDVDAHAAGVALNRVGEAGGWKKDELYAMLDEFRASSTEDEDLLLGLGFDGADLDAMLADIELEKITPSHSSTEPIADTREIIVPEKGSERTKRGDVWLLGDHRVMCGDCRDPADLDVLFLDGERVNVAFTSPPYADRRKYDEASGFTPIRPDDYVEWFAAVAAGVRGRLADDGSWFVNIKAGVTPDGVESELYVLDLVLAHAREWGWHFVTEFCWERNGVPKQVRTRFKNQWEPVYQFTIGAPKVRPDAVRIPSENVPRSVPGSPALEMHGNAEDWQGGRDGGPRIGETNWAGEQGGPDIFAVKRRAHGIAGNMSNAQGSSSTAGEFIGPGLAYPGNRLPTFAGSHDATGHPAAFPVGLPAWFVRAYTDARDVVYDPFVGSGSTVLAAAQEGRLGRGIEISPGYVDVTCARWQKAHGALPVLAATGAAVDFLSGL